MIQPKKKALSTSCSKEVEKDSGRLCTALLGLSTGVRMTSLPPALLMLPLREPSEEEGQRREVS